jgi:hypothetical protein
MSVHQGVSTGLSITEAAEALLKTLTLQPKLFVENANSSVYGTYKKTIRDKFKPFIRMPLFYLSWNHFNIDFRINLTF